ncbi:hypothetical protein [Nocardioides yefusunii]|uniref:Uncharacterized protein n=1 Tax=Nocardioides yefusunii TaxID=2500546 RepID=A0ABW1QTX7_9ACTN|nr:hypothetical protein [Nocardioides yefusunii]
MKVRALLAVVLVAASLSLLPSRTLTAEAAPQRTTVVVKAPTCNGCTIVVERVLDRRTGRAWSQRRTVRSGRATFSIPTAYTRGSTFWVAKDKRYTAVRDAVPLVVTRFGASATGARVKATWLSSYRTARVCWGGTDKSRVTVGLGTASSPGYASRASTRKTRIQRHYWFRPTLASQGPRLPVRGGVVGTQDDVRC